MDEKDEGGRMSEQKRLPKAVLQSIKIRTANVSAKHDRQRSPNSEGEDVGAPPRKVAMLELQAEERKEIHHPPVPVSSSSTSSAEDKTQLWSIGVSSSKDKTPGTDKEKSDAKEGQEEVDQDMEEGELSDEEEAPPPGPSPPTESPSVTPVITPDPPTPVDGGPMTLDTDVQRPYSSGSATSGDSVSPALPDRPALGSVVTIVPTRAKEPVVPPPMDTELGEAADMDIPPTTSEPVPVAKAEKKKMPKKLPKAMLLSLCPKPKPGKAKTAKVALRVNMFPLSLGDKTKLFRYQITVTEQFKGKQRVLTKGAPDDFHREEKRSACYDLVMRDVVKKNKEFFGDKEYAVIYDRQNMFYSLAKLDVGISKTFQVPGKEPGFDSEFLVRFDPGEPETLDLTDFHAQLTLKLADKDRSVTQALELMTSQVLFYKDEYKCFGGNFYDNSAQRQNLGDGKCLAEGLQKSVKIVDSGTEPEAVVCLDLKKTAFFKPQPVIETLMEMCQIRSERDLERGMDERQARMFSYQMKDIVVRTTHGERARTLTVNGLSEKGAHEIDLDYKDPAKGYSRTMTVADFFVKRYKKRLRFPHLPCLVEKRGKQTNYYPMEVCEVAENQRVPLKKQGDMVTRALIKAAAVPPNQRQGQIQEMRDKARLNSNRHLSALGAKMSSKMLKVKGRTLPVPIIEYKDDRTVKVDPRGTWELAGSQWLVGGRCGKWGVIWLEQRTDARVVQQFMQRFEEGCQLTGTKLGRCVMEAFVPVDGLDCFFRDAVRKEVEFLLCVCSDKKEKYIHDKIKLAEIQHHVQTQCITFNILRQCSNVSLGRGGPRKFVDILTKFLSKTNAKLGGTNHSVFLENNDFNKKWFGKGVMYIGVDVNHPPPQSRLDKIRGIPPSEPSVVGFVANRGDSCFHFTGDYRYQNARVEVVVEGMDKMMEDFLERYREPTSSKALPNKIVYFRDGVSEGQFQQVLENELYLMEKACRRVGGEEYKPKFTVIIVLKRHPVRFFPLEMNPRAKPPDQNIPYGTVIDKTVVDPMRWEFYLCSHRAVQGTTKVPKYTVIRDDNKCKSDDIQQMCYILAHGHQIITQTVSLPAPAYGAHEVAMRGKRLYLAKMSRDDISSRYGSDDREQADNNWEDLNAELSTKGTVFATKKHWA